MELDSLDGKEGQVLPGYLEVLIITWYGGGLSQCCTTACPCSRASKPPAELRLQYHLCFDMASVSLVQFSDPLNLFGLAPIAQWAASSLLHSAIM